MAINYTSLLGFALPVTGTEANTWGTTVNDSITELVEDAIAAAATASVASGDWTLTTTGSGAANQARCAILIPTGSPGVSRNIIAPSQSKAYVVINQSDAAVVLKGSATTGTTIASGTEAVCAWNGSDFVTVGTADIGNLTGTLNVARGGTGAVSLTGVVKGNGTSAFTASNVNLASEVTGTLPVANGGTGNTTIAARSVFVANVADTLTTVTPTAGQSIRVNSGNTAWEAYTPSTGTGDAVLANNNAFTGANTFYNNTGQTFGTGTAAQDGIILTGRAGGSSTYRVSITPATLTASRTVTLPNANTTIPIASQPITLSGPSAARTYTFPDANATVLTTNAAVTVSQGGTGATTLTANNVILGNGTSAVNFVAPGTSGNVLTSDGTTWASTAPAGGGFSNITVFTSSTTWTVPSGVTKCKVTVVGAGGSGGSSDNQDYYAAGGGGGGGTAIKILSLSGSSATITVGTGGSSVSNARASGNTGGTSSFVYGVTTISATGGAGGTASDAANTIQGGAGGIGSSGDLNIGGQGGGTATWATGVNGLRGGGGAGGSSVYGGGGFGLTNSSANTSPGAGRAYGGGGAGGNSQVASGAGADGVVFVEY